jgi:pimeloyl-ACP methyl ester carboxylesterase
MHRHAKARAAMVVALALLLAACRTPAPVAIHVPAEEALAQAREAATAADRESDLHRASALWIRCASLAWQGLQFASTEDRGEAARLDTESTDRLLVRALAMKGDDWSEGDVRIDGVALRLAFRDLSPALRPPLRLTRAQDVSMDVYGGMRYARGGFGVPLAVVSPRCEDGPRCALFPPEGVFRSATAWIEAGGAGEPPVLVLADPLRNPAVAVNGASLPLAMDTSAPLASGAQRTKLPRIAVWGLLGGDEVGRRAGVYLLEDYDPNKRPLVMIHGLGSSPLIWARLSNAIWGDADLRARYQVWHVVYQTNAPLLVERLRVKRYLDAAWQALDPEHDDAARNGIVLVGHSLGGVIARMLCVDSGTRLWDAAFLAPPDRVHASAADIEALQAVFLFDAYPGVTRAIFIAAPHRGSPRAANWFGRLMRVVVGKRTREIQALQRIAREDPASVRPELLPSYRDGALNSITTLQVAQPVRAAGEKLMPRADIPYHTIAGALPRSDPKGDGVVPLDSARLDGAQSTLVLPADHYLYDNPDAIAEVLRILREAP